MSTVSKLLLMLALGASSVIRPPATWSAPKPPLCSAGRFAVAGDPLIGPGGEVVVLQDRKIAVGTLCGERRAKLRRRKKGTSVIAAFSKGSCDGVARKARLKAMITDDCSVMTGTFSIRGVATDFTATTSVCGDDVVDVGLGEQCDGSAAGCDAGEACSADCKCQATRADKSSPIELTADGGTLVAANTDADTISFFEVGDDARLTKLQEVAVGQEPRSVATLVSKPWVYVANTVSGTVSVIDVNDYTTVATIDVGTEPQAIVASPNGRFVYVATANDNAVDVIDTATNQVVETIAVGRSPRALAITNDGDGDDLDEHLYVPSFFARPRAGFVPPISTGLGGADGAGSAFPSGARGEPIVGEGIFDDSREAVVDVVSTATNTVVDQVVLAPIADTGFKLARGAFVNSTPTDAPRTIFADGGTDGTVAQNTGAFPNLLQSIAIFDGRGFVPSSAASPEPPLRLNGNVQSLMSVFDVDSNAELADQTFNMNRGINFDVPPGLLEAQVRDNTDRLFPSVPVDIDCSDATGVCWVVSQGSDFIVRMDFEASGKPTINAPTAAGPFAQSPVVRIPTIDPANATSSGRNPRGIVLDADGTHGYVVCPTTRDVVVADLVGNTVLERVRSSELPTDTLQLSILRGKIDFFTSRPFWSDRGWGGCASCHPDGRTDNVTWSFEAGPRQTISLDGTFSNLEGLGDQRLLNWTPVRDENPDFELNTRGVFGGRGFITTNTDVNADGITPDSDPNVRNYGPASSDRSTQQTDITNWIALAVRSPIAPPSTSGDPERGRDIFGAAAPGGANCVACHSGAKWTTSRVTFDPVDVNPIPGTDTGIVNIADLGAVFLNGFNSAAGAGRACEVPAPPGADERLRIMRQVGTFAATNPIEVRHGAISPVNTVAPALAVAAAFGGDGFNTPTLLGIGDTAPYFRAGAAASLEEVFGIGTDVNVLPAAIAHWRAGTGGDANVLDDDPSAITDLISFLRTIDDGTTPFPAADLAPDDPTFADAAALCDCAKDVPVGAPVLDCRP
ncbi:MAG TPA: beta-propeller fold lactonase family protein [Candidatus Binatia bacterium]|jgi:YVTN family beta-propeller protein|nr:beta-propeller fold lactonase family protein [Candidatus Binatia bacterium]